jgi:hypothetical protein
MFRASEKSQVVAFRGILPALKKILFGQALNMRKEDGYSNYS